MGSLVLAIAGPAMLRLCAFDGPRAHVAIKCGDVLSSRDDFWITRQQTLSRLTTLYVHTSERQRQLHLPLISSDCLGAVAAVSPYLCRCGGTSMNGKLFYSIKTAIRIYCTLAIYRLNWLIIGVCQEGACAAFRADSSQIVRLQARSVAATLQQPRTPGNAVN